MIPLKKRYNHSNLLMKMPTEYINGCFKVLGKWKFGGPNLLRGESVRSWENRTLDFIYKIWEIIRKENKLGRILKILKPLINKIKIIKKNMKLNFIEMGFIW